ncbi:unnamed protein product [Rhizophagus irregularis]|nr:unnamed protein product [Rhizophagus irregularis]
MKKCWDPNPDNRPNASEIEESINSFSSSEKSEKIKNQFEKSEKYRIANLENSFDSITDSSFKTHSGAVYTSRNFSFKISELPNMNDYDQNKGEIVQNNSLLIDFSKLDLYKSDVQNEGEEKFETM